MNPYKKAAQFLIRLVAASLIIVGGMLAGLEFLNHCAKHVDVNLLKIAMDSFVFIAGVILFAVSSRLAARLTDESEERNDKPTPDS